MCARRERLRRPLDFTAVPIAVTVIWDLVERPPPSQFHWLDAGLGAAMTLGMAMIATGVVVGVRRRALRRRRSPR